MYQAMALRDLVKVKLANDGTRAPFESPHGTIGLMYRIVVEMYDRSCEVEPDEVRDEMTL
jgi:hypothetical protein